MKIIQFLFLTLIISILNGCANTPEPHNQVSSPYTQAYQVIGDKQVIVRAITNQAQCPSIQWDKGAPVKMQTRAEPGTIPLRKSSDQVATEFPIKTCEIVWPHGVLIATVNGQTMQALKTDIKRIVIVADTGCRLKASENAYQDCNTVSQYPFSLISQNAAKMNPDMVIHIGDIHYRESPCPPDRAGCKNSPWGYGFDTWKADLFEPAKPLLEKAPWVFVRGNHEACSRAGQGWHRFIDIRSWNEQLSCNDPKNDNAGSYSEPYAVPIGASSQIVVFDSANMPSKEIRAQDVSFKIYSEQIKKAEELARQKSFSIFANHHPISIVLPSKPESPEDLVLKLNSLGVLMKDIQGDALLSSNFNASLHGHIHTVQAISYQNSHPMTLISGNGGSALEELKVRNISLNSAQKKQLKIKEFESYLDFGFATLDRQDEEGLQWLFTEFNREGKKIFSCLLAKNQMICKK
jgi:hypothetical protein